MSSSMIKSHWMSWKRPQREAHLALLGWVPYVHMEDGVRIVNLADGAFVMPAGHGWGRYTIESLQLMELFKWGKWGTCDWGNMPSSRFSASFRAVMEGRRGATAP